MGALTDNPLANMRGPEFLVVYALIAFVVVVGLILLGTFNGGDSSRPLPPVPARPDPYELAYLRDGPAGAVWLAIYALKRAGFVDLAKGRLQPLAVGAAPNNAYEAAVLRAIGQGCAPSQIIRDRAPGGSIGSLFSRLESRLAISGLVRDEASRRRVIRAALWTGAALLGLALYKAAIATANGHHNIGGLIVECFFALLALAVCARALGRRRANQRGRMYLDRAKIAYERPTRNTGAATAAGDDSLAALLVGIYGFQILAGGPDAAFAQQARAAQSSGSGGGCSSGGGGGGCGGGGGGCGGCGGS